MLIASLPLQPSSAGGLFWWWSVGGSLLGSNIFWQLSSNLPLLRIHKCLAHSQACYLSQVWTLTLLSPTLRPEQDLSLGALFDISVNWWRHLLEEIQGEPEIICVKVPQKAGMFQSGSGSFDFDLLPPTNLRVSKMYASNNSYLLLLFFKWQDEKYP